MGPVEREHLETGGDHLLAGDCWICDKGIEASRSNWIEHRNELIKGWRYPFPMFAQVVLERAPMHPFNATRDGDNLIWRLIQSSLAMEKPQNA